MLHKKHIVCLKCLTIFLFSMISHLYAEFESNVIINFQKPIEILINQSASVTVNIKAVYNLKNVEINISLPSHVSLVQGQLTYRESAMTANNQYTYPLQLSIADPGHSMPEKITVKVLSHSDGESQADYADLFLISYSNKTEILDIYEVHDDSIRVWKAVELTPQDLQKIVPNPNANTEIQLQPENIPVDSSMNYNFDEDINRPYVTPVPVTSSPQQFPQNQIVPEKEIGVTVKGILLFKASDDSLHPIRHARVEIWDEDGEFNPDDHLGTTTTDGNGNYSKYVKGSDGWFGKGRHDLEIYLKIKTTNPGVAVLKRRLVPGFKKPYEHVTLPISTRGGTLIINRQLINYGEHTIFYRMNDAYFFTKYNGYTPKKVEAVYPNDGNGAHYNTFFTSRKIYFSGTSSTDWYSDVVGHEYGHALMHRAQDYWWPDHTGGPHNVNENLHKNFAWTEGWATAYELFVHPDGKYDFRKGRSLELEDKNSFDGRFYLPYGKRNEGRIAAALFDLYDSKNENFDQSSISYSTIIDILRGHRNSNIDDFWANLKQRLSPSERKKAARTIIYNTILIEGGTAVSKIPFMHNGITVSRPDIWDVAKGGSDIYYRIIVNSPTTVDITLCDPNGRTNYDTQLAVFQDTGKLIASNNNSPNFCQTNPGVSSLERLSLSTFVKPGTRTEYPGEYYIVVDGYNGAIGNYKINISSSAIADTGVTKPLENSKTSDQNLAKKESSQSNQESTLLPKTTKLFDPYPNPFNPSTKFRYNLAKDSQVTLIIYDLTGREVTRLLNKANQSRGPYSIKWDINRDASKQSLASGVYIYRIVAKSSGSPVYTKSGRIVLIK